MIIDSSAIIEVILRLARHQEVLEKIISAESLGVGAPTLVESSLVLSTRVKRSSINILADFIREAEIEVIPFGYDHYRLALDAFERFGKGKHPAALNFGDCLTYATAALAQRPLLFIGDDFSKTDLISA